jgi:ubiquinone/menaquinone biosynthesis C-methylase UbiE
MPDLTPNFDNIARPYRWLEYLSFGPFLERCRFQYLDRLNTRQRAIVLGDGDGRFTAKLLAANSQITVDAIDSSAKMLELLTQRVSRLGPGALSRLLTTQSTAQTLTLDGPVYDLIGTHFFLDCLTEDDLERLVQNIKSHLASGAIWLISEFAIPATGPMNPISRLIVTSLYKTFRALTGLKVQRLPSYARFLTRAEFSLLDQKTHIGGLLVSELWILDSHAQTTARPPDHSHQQR